MDLELVDPVEYCVCLVWVIGGNGVEVLGKHSEVIGVCIIVLGCWCGWCWCGACVYFIDVELMFVSCSWLSHIVGCSLVPAIHEASVDDFFYQGRWSYCHHRKISFFLSYLWLHIPYQQWHCLRCSSGGVYCGQQEDHSPKTNVWYT